MVRPDTEYTITDQDRMKAAKRYFRWQADLALRHLGQRVVEVGCGLGNFTELLLNREQVVAVDVENHCVDRLVDRFAGAANLRAFVMDASDDDFRSLRSFSPDSCVCLNVLEHIENDREALANMASVLPPRGRIVLIVPAHESLYGPIDRNLGHFRRYTKSSLKALCEEVGLKAAKLHYMNFVGLFGWWVNAHLLKKEAQSAAQIAFFDNWVVPVMARVEAVVYPPIGQSLFAVLEKK